MTATTKPTTATRRVQRGWLDFAQTIPHMVDVEISAHDERREYRIAEGLETPPPSQDAIEAVVRAMRHG